MKKYYYFSLLYCVVFGIYVFSSTDLTRFLFVNRFYFRMIKTVIILLGLVNLFWLGKILMVKQANALNMLFQIMIIGISHFLLSICHYRYYDASFFENHMVHTLLYFFLVVLQVSNGYILFVSNTPTKK